MFTKKLFTTLLMSTVLTAAIPSWSQPSGLAGRCESIFTSVSVKADNRAFDNLTKYEQLFTKGRGLGTYQLAMGKEFTESFHRLLQLPHSHWFDSGAGHAFAVRQALELPEARHLKSTVVAYETSATSEGPLKVIAGRFLENIADHEIPKSDLITDVFGPMAYSSQPHTVLKKYVNNLKENGEIYIYLGARHELYGESNKVVTAKGEVLTLGEWLKSIPGLKTELIKTKKDDDGAFFYMWTLKITKEQGDVQIPNLEMIHFKEGAPPTMTFKEVTSSPSTQLFAQQNQLKQTLQASVKNTGVSEFLDAFRGGEFRHPLIASIKSLGKEDRWLNVTDVGDSVLQGMKTKSYNFEDTQVFIGLAQKFIRWRASKINPDKFSYTSLKDTQSLADFKDIKLITDYYGEFTSSLTPDVILTKYLQALSNKGEIYLYMGKEYGGFGSESMVMTKQGQKIPLRKWIMSLPGIKAKLFRGGYYWAGGEWAFLRINITDRRQINIPQLQLMGTSVSEQGAPMAYFQEI